MISETSSLYKYGAAIQGFIIWGGWAFYINSKVSFWDGVVSGLVQGVSSFVATFVIISMLTKLFNYFQNGVYKLFFPPLLMTLVMTVMSTLIHKIAGTPELLKTITPSLIMTILFCSYTVYKLNRVKK